VLRASAHPDEVAATCRTCTSGNWEFPGTAKQIFWSPPECGSTHIIHKDANLKPLRAQLYFRAPPKGTGTITFRTLIKRGNPNLGEFFYPNAGGRLTLQEADTAADPVAPALSLAPKGGSCSGYCQGLGQQCDAGAMRSQTSSSAQGLMAMFAPTAKSVPGVATTVLCRPPLLQACSPVAPVRRAPAARSCLRRAAWPLRAAGRAGRAAAAAGPPPLPAANRPTRGGVQQPA